jgi:hypothetical protein
MAKHAYHTLQEHPKDACPSPMLLTSHTDVQKPFRTDTLAFSTTENVSLRLTPLPSRVVRLVLGVIHTRILFSHTPFTPSGILAGIQNHSALGWKSPSKESTFTNAPNTSVWHRAAYTQCHTPPFPHSGQ